MYQNICKDNAYFVRLPLKKDELSEMKIWFRNGLFDLKKFVYICDNTDAEMCT